MNQVDATTQSRRPELVQQMRSTLLARLEGEPPAARDRRKGRYPIGLTDWDEELDRPSDDNVPTRLVCLE